MKLGTKEIPALRLGAAAALKAYLGGSQVWPLGFDPASLFAQGEQGVWYDPSDMTTLFQDPAGTTPVTAVEQPVGLMLDKSRGLVLGPELVTNGDFSNGTTGWTASGTSVTLSSSSGKLRIETTFANGIATQIVTTVVGKLYVCQFDWVGTNSTGNTTFGAGSVSSITLNASTPARTFKIYFWATSTSSAIQARVSGGGPFYVEYDNISVRELPGNHASQPTATARGLYKDPPKRIDYDGIDDLLTTTFPINLGSNCTVARAVPSVGAQILTAQTIGTSYEDSEDHAGLIIINRALTAVETAAVTSYLNRAY